MRVAMGQVTQPGGALKPPAAEAGAGFAKVLAQKEASASAAPVAGGQDFTRMTVGELDQLGMRLFRAGDISLDELFHFQHPSGTLRVGQEQQRPSPAMPVDFLGRIRDAVVNLEARGEAWQPKSPYPVYRSLLAKLEAWHRPA